MSTAPAFPPVLRILATGGTIAGTARDAQDPLHYQAATLSIEHLLAAVPALQALPARLHAEQILQKDSKDLDAADWLTMAHAIAAALADPQVAGVVVTHGTDTLEETAWFLHRVLPATAKPVVLVSAMRPATALGADGPQNLLDACIAALSGRLQGVVAVAAGEVHDALRVQKLRPYRIPAFHSGDAGPVAWIEAGHVQPASPCAAAQPATDALWRAGSHQALLHTAADSLGPPPSVAWVSSHAAFDARQIHALAAAGFDGLLVAGTGNGTLHHALEAALPAARQAGMAVALTSRCAFGHVVTGDSEAASGPWRVLRLPAAKARVELMLELWRQVATQ